jgi:hypothetical protein
MRPGTSRSHIGQNGAFLATGEMEARAGLDKSHEQMHCRRQADVVDIAILIVGYGERVMQRGLEADGRARNHRFGGAFSATAEACRLWFSRVVHLKRRSATWEASSHRCWMHGLGPGRTCS